MQWLAPLLAAAAALTRLDSLPLALVVLLWVAVAQRWRVRRLALMALLLAAVLVPAFAGNAQTRGEAAPASTVIATANWKEEFRDRLGTPGFEETRRVTAFEYLFRYHAPGQLLWYTGRGVARIYGDELFDSLYYRLAGVSAGLGGWGRYLGLESRWLGPALFLAGSLALLGRWRRWRTAWLPLALCVVGVLPPIGFIAGVPQRELYQARYAYLVAPFANGILAWACLALAGGAATAAAFVWRGRMGAGQGVRLPDHQNVGAAPLRGR